MRGYRFLLMTTYPQASLLLSAVIAVIKMVIVVKPNQIDVLRFRFNYLEEL